MGDPTPDRKKKPLMTEAESDAVGWDDEIIETYPKASLMPIASRVQLIRWHRFLREPKTPDEIQFVDNVIGELERTCPQPEQPKEPEPEPVREPVEAVESENSNRVDAATVLSNLLHDLTGE